MSMSHTTFLVLLPVAAYIYYFLCTLTPVVDSPLVDSTSSSPLEGSSGFRCAVAVVGTALYVAGSIGQHQAHCILAQLRDGAKQPSSPATGSRYSVPFGSLFQYVSMPHYFCEMVEYTGLWMISGLRMSQLSVDIAVLHSRFLKQSVASS
jgi:hypothetical protein